MWQNDAAIGLLWGKNEILGTNFQAEILARQNRQDPAWTDRKTFKMHT